MVGSAPCQELSFCFLYYREVPQSSEEVEDKNPLALGIFETG